MSELDIDNMNSVGNFGFLSVHDVTLVQFGTRAERYYFDDPMTSIIKLRQFADFLSKGVAAQHSLYEGKRETFEVILRRLSFRGVISVEVANLFHALRRIGNSAMHEARGDHSDALTALKIARELGIWFHRAYGNQPDFDPGPFMPPVRSAEIVEDIVYKLPGSANRQAPNFAERRDEPRARISESAEDRAKRDREEQERLKSLIERLDEITRKLPGQLHKEGTEPARRQDPADNNSFDSVKEPWPPMLDLEEEASDFMDADPFWRSDMLQPTERISGAEMMNLIARAEDAAARINLDETAMRVLTDLQHGDADWEADTSAIRKSSNRPK